MQARIRTTHNIIITASQVISNKTMLYICELFLLLHTQEGEHKSKQETVRRVHALDANKL